MVRGFDSEHPEDMFFEKLGMAENRQIGGDACDRACFISQLMGLLARAEFLLFFCISYRSIYHAEKSLSPYAIRIVNHARVFPFRELLLLDTRAVGKNCLYHEWECILPET